MENGIDQAEMPQREMHDGHETSQMQAHSLETEPETVAYQRDAQSRNAAIPPLHARSEVATSNLASGGSTDMPTRKITD